MVVRVDSYGLFYAHKMNNTKFFFQLYLNTYYHSISWPIAHDYMTGYITPVLKSYRYKLRKIVVENVENKVLKKMIKKYSHLSSTSSQTEEECKMTIFHGYVHIYGPELDNSVMYDMFRNLRQEIARATYHPSSGSNLFYEETLESMKVNFKSLAES